MKYKPEKRKTGRVKKNKNAVEGRRKKEVRDVNTNK